MAFYQAPSGAFLILFVTALIWAVNETFFPYFIKLIVNTIHDYKGIPANIYSVLTVPVASMFSVWFVMEAAMRIQGVTTVYAFPRFRANIREAVYAYVKEHSYEYFSNNFAGSIAKKLSDLPQAVRPSWKI